MSTTWYDVFDNVNNGFKHLEESFDKTVSQMNQLKRIEIGDIDVYNVIGELFFNREILTITQLSTVKKELKNSLHFKHLGDDGFSAYDMYNACTEALKSSHPTMMIRDHVKLHRYFEETFSV